MGGDWEAIIDGAVEIFILLACSSFFFSDCCFIASRGVYLNEFGWYIVNLNISCFC